MFLQPGDSACTEGLFLDQADRAIDAYLVEPGQGRDQVGPFCGDLKTFQSPLHRCRVLLVLGLCSEVPVSLGMVLCSHCHTRSLSHGHWMGGIS